MDLHQLQAFDQIIQQGSFSIDPQIHRNCLTATLAQIYNNKNRTHVPQCYQLAQENHIKRTICFFPVNKTDTVAFLQAGIKGSQSRKACNMRLKQLQ